MFCLFNAVLVHKFTVHTFKMKFLLYTRILLKPLIEYSVFELINSNENNEFELFY